jgi:hypothetical protein
MMSFTTEEMTVLSAQMDEQLQQLRDLEKHFKSGASKSGSESLDMVQRELPLYPLNTIFYISMVYVGFQSFSCRLVSLKLKLWTPL